MRNTVNFSKEEAIRLKNGAIGVEHLYLGMMRCGECSGLNMLTALGVDIMQLKERLEKQKILLRPATRWKIPSR